MFGNIAAFSFAQHTRLDEMIAEATAAGAQVDGVLVENPLVGVKGGVVRIALVIDNEPATGSEYDRTFDFEGGELGRGKESVKLTIDALASALAETAEPVELL
jgi:hypothetical protein